MDFDEGRRPGPEEEVSYLGLDEPPDRIFAFLARGPSPFKRETQHLTSREDILT
jgi:hypothetical protein